MNALTFAGIGMASLHGRCGRFEHAMSVVRPQFSG